MSDDDGDTDRSSAADEESGPPANKVARLLESYGLGQPFGDRMADLWTAEGDRRESLRSLADRFNKRLLEGVMADAGMSTLDGEIDNLYRLLTDDDVSAGNRTEARRRLERAGVDVDQVERDFVTYQAIRSYLKDYRGVEYERDSEPARVESVIETLQRLKTRTTTVAENSLAQLRKSDRITLGEFRLFVEINVLCEDCQTQYGVVELLRDGGCNCPVDDTDSE
ncbi:MAG: rod-determining factor RdfA [Halorientalis sp.]